MRTSDMRERDVIDVLTGRRLGNVEDLDIDVETGRVRALIIPGERRLLGFLGTGGKELRIPWSAVQVVGEDAILVRGEQVAASEGGKEGLWGGPETDDPGGDPHRRGGVPRP
ncbi:MAG: YlmC/YmxH family sporulation protein [Clostridia bacterium]|nr:YlmC/YmxH family sporulation protein [Clostridia bacterium]MCL6521990.1 YlmC/YmxH family sporulation protein [Bacillota bacterium]